MSELEELTKVLAAHARLLEAHARAISRDERLLREIRAELAGVVAAQKETNQIMAGIHSLWARLECVRPGGRPPSSELRVVGCGRAEEGNSDE